MAPAVARRKPRDSEREVLAPRSPDPEGLHEDTQAEGADETIARWKRMPPKPAARSRITLQKQKPKEATRMARWKHPDVKADSTRGSRP